MAGGAFPYDLNNLLGGAVRVLWAPAQGAGAAAVPADPADIFAQVSPYAPTTNWNDFGATDDAFSYSRGIDVEGWEIQQATGNVVEEVTDTTRSVTVSLAELTPEALQIIEEAPSIDTIAAAAGSSAYDKVGFGSIRDLTRYRIAFVSRRSRQSGLVEEPSGAERGRYVVGVGYLCAISADETELSQAKGELSSTEVTFTFFPDGAQPEGQEHGAWFFEQAGTIAA